ncbi:MAG: tRNA lysidine(34) synthetase TilS, partial [Pseudomonadota bacterium]
MPAPDVACVEEVFASLDRLTENLEGTLGIALSGGSDSSALLVITAEWAKAKSRQLVAATVDHQLRPESGEEAILAGNLSKKFGIPHQVIHWDPAATGQDQPNNLSARAREARHQLLGAWAREQGLKAVLLGHTMDDQAETVLMRLIRGSGADGLSAMDEKVLLKGTLWLRPILRCRRDNLRTYLTARGVGWSDDPTNQNETYERVRIRNVIAGLKITPEGLAKTAETLGRQRQVLEIDRDRLAQEAVSIGKCGELH